MNAVARRVKPRTLSCPVGSCGRSTLMLWARSRLAHLWLRWAVLAFESIVGIATLTTPVAVAERADAGQRWIGTWATSPLLPDPVGTTDQAVLSRTGFTDQTLRQIVYPHFSGSQIRVRLANTFGDQPLMIGQTNIATQDQAAAIMTGSDRRLTFGGQPSVMIPAGAQAVSDPVSLNVDATHSLAISTYLPGPTGPITWHSTARQTLYVASGNQAADATGGEFEARPNVPSWYVISGVEVAASSLDQA